MTTANDLQSQLTAALEQLARQRPKVLKKNSVPRLMTMWK